MLAHYDPDLSIPPQGFKDCCSNGSMKDGVVLRSDGVLEIKQIGIRTELATERMPIDKRTRGFFSLEIEPIEDRFVFAQVISWQPPCFDGGNYQFVYDHGDVYIITRNIGKKEEIKLLGGVTGGEITLSFDAFFSDKSGWFYITIINRDKSFSTYIYDNEPTIVSCPLGPYFKVGTYNGKSSPKVLLKYLKITFEE